MPKNTKWKKAQVHPEGTEKQCLKGGAAKDNLGAASAPQVWASGNAAALTAAPTAPPAPQVAAPRAVLPPVRTAEQRRADALSDEHHLLKQVVGLIAAARDLSTESGSSDWDISRVLNYKVQEEKYAAPWTFRARIYQWAMCVDVRDAPERVPDLGFCLSVRVKPEMERELLHDEEFPGPEKRAKQWKKVHKVHKERRKREKMREAWRDMMPAQELEWERCRESVDWGVCEFVDFARVAAEINAARGY